MQIAACAGEGQLLNRASFIASLPSTSFTGYITFFAVSIISSGKIQAHRVSGVTCCLPGDCTNDGRVSLGVVADTIREGCDGLVVLESDVVRKGAVPTPICPELIVFLRGLLGSWYLPAAGHVLRSRWFESSQAPPLKFIAGHLRRKPNSRNRALGLSD